MTVAWKAVVYAGKDAQGRQRQRSRSGHSRNLQQATRDKRAAHVALTNELAAEKVEAATFGGMCDEWMKAMRHHAVTTRYANGVMIGRIKAEIGRVPLAKLNAQDLDHLYARLLDGDKKHPPLSPSSVNHYHRVIRSVLRQAWKWDRVPSVVAAKATPPPKTSGKKVRPPTPEALHALVASAPPSLKMAAILSAATGLRRGEVVGLWWSDIQGDQLNVERAAAKVPGRPLEIKPTKSGKERTVTLDVDRLGLLVAHRMFLEQQAKDRGSVLVADGPIFAKMRTDPTGATPYLPGWVTGEWRRLCKKNGVRFRFHDLRHFHATQLIAGGVPAKVVQERLGHANIGITMDVYTHALKASDAQAAEVIGRVLALPAPPESV